MHVSAYDDQLDTWRHDFHQGHKNRLGTLLMYLSDALEGGETQFPRAMGLKSPRNTTKCQWGIRVKPTKTKSIIFYSLTPDGQGDPYSIHGGCPGGAKGTKWAVNQWIWNKPVVDTSPGNLEELEAVKTTEQAELIQEE